MEEKIYTKSSASVCWFRNHQTGAFLLPGKFKKGAHFCVRFAEMRVDSRYYPVLQ